jgi:hypothetical protein
VTGAEVGCGTEGAVVGLLVIFFSNIGTSVGSERGDGGINLFVFL